MFRTRARAGLCMTPPSRGCHGHRDSSQHDVDDKLTPCSSPPPRASETSPEWSVCECKTRLTTDTLVCGGMGDEERIMCIRVLFDVICHLRGRAEHLKTATRRTRVVGRGRDDMEVVLGGAELDGVGRWRHHAVDAGRRSMVALTFRRCRTVSSSHTLSAATQLQRISL